MFTLLLTTALANEGMWLPEQLPALSEELKRAGLTTTAKDLARLDKGPLAAMLDVNNGCSGAFVSDAGLIVTAYHCIGPAARHASDPGQNLFETGFYAPTRADERWAGPSFSVKVTLSQEDVTDQVMNGTKRLTGAERVKRIETNTRALEKRCERPGVHCEVVPFDSGASYELVAMQEFKDVRVVYTPPRPVGYFGGDADNWQWPRHSGDFAYLRAYADTDNAPTSYRPDNKPFKPAAFLPTAMRSPDPGQFVMVASYPSGTYRWRSAAEIDYARDSNYPRRIATFADVLGILHRFADDDPATASKVDPRILSLNNQMQYTQGNLAAFRRINANQRKWAFEQAMAKWIAESPERQQKYGTLLDDMRRLQAEEAATAARDHVASQFRSNSVMFEVGFRLYRLAKESEKKDADRAVGFRQRDRNDFADFLASVDERYAYKVDMELTRYFLDRLLSLPQNLRVPELDNWFEQQRGANTAVKIDNAVNALYTTGGNLSDSARRRALMDTSAWYLDKSGNPWFELSGALLPFYERMDQAKADRDAKWAEVRPAYLAAIQEFLPIYQKTGAGSAFYPDANGTLRVSFGKVEGFFPRDGLIASPKTRLEGILVKAGDPPYDAPVALVNAIEKKRFGPYAEPGGVPVNFLTTVDTTLGSSGSATVNAKGEFCGVLFDGNYESMATDWVFEESLTRSIHTDSAYILWYLDAVAGADALLQELGHKPSIDTQAP